MVSKSQTDSAFIAPTVSALMHTVIDYAGLFPPAALTLVAAIDNYESYDSGPHAWMLGRLVVRAADLDMVPAHLEGHLSVLAGEDHKQAAAIESTSAIHCPKPVYCEVSVKQLDQLDLVKATGCFAKIRTGGVKPEAIPTCAEVAAFMAACAERKLAFKATAGLHHAIRAVHPLTYDAGAPGAVMHGFINVLMAAAFAWHGTADVEPILAETDPEAFRFNQQAFWRDKSLSQDQLRAVRRQFLHSIGSCSFDEPVAELQALSLLG